MIDTHCHLTSDHYADRTEQVVAAARAAGVHGMISVATTIVDAQAAVRLASAHEHVWFTSGVHPLYADDPDDAARDWQAMTALAREPKCVAWGELGLDNHYDKPARDVQRRVLADQLAQIESAAADGTSLPVIVHCRKAFDDLLAVFRESSLPADRFVFHCFTGTPDEARLVLDFGAWISFTGVVTFANAPEVAEAAKIVPDDRLMVETDAPYLTPEPHRKVRPNEPKYVLDVARRLAGLRGMSFDDFASLADANAKRFFNLDA